MEVVALLVLNCSGLWGWVEIKENKLCKPVTPVIMAQQNKRTLWPNPFGGWDGVTSGSSQDALGLWLRKAELRKGRVATSQVLRLLKFSQQSCFAPHHLGGNLGILRTSVLPPARSVPFSWSPPQ